METLNYSQLSTWIELQDTVNVYMDGSLDNRASNSPAANTGIRQVRASASEILRCRST